mgnify:CR=1 FL=1
MRTMTTNPHRLLLRAAVLVLAAVPFLATGFAPRPEAEPVAIIQPTADAGTPPVVEVEHPELVRLAPGTRFRDDAPSAGWSHVAFKSTPVLASGALDTLSPEAHATARRIRLVILADVAGAKLRRVGIGLSAPVVGEGPDAGDVVVAATNVGDVSGEWSTKERIILAAGSRELGRASLAAATPTFALLRAPTTCLVGQGHETVGVMYALLAQPSGRLRLFACKPAADGSAPTIRELKTPAIVDGPLHVKAKTFAGYPVSWSFAMTDIPAGDERRVPEELTRLLSLADLEAAEVGANEVEAAFRAFAGRPTIAPTARADVPGQGD